MDDHHFVTDISRQNKTFIVVDDTIFSSYHVRYSKELFINTCGLTLFSGPAILIFRLAGWRKVSDGRRGS